jgi:hypothetical protein
MILSALWPTMTAEQRQGLLGDATWLAFDATGTLQRYAADDMPAPGVTPDIARLKRFNAQQSTVLKNAGLVNDLLPRWKTLLDERGLRLPPDAQSRLHAHVQEAQAHGLDDESIAIHVLVSVQLKPGATQDPQWLALVRDAARQGRLLVDELKHLKETFWDRWSLYAEEDTSDWPMA